MQNISYVPVGCVRFARYCDKMYSCHLFLYGGLGVIKSTVLELQVEYLLYASKSSS